jgi:hypothetical protein
MATVVGDTPGITFSMTKHCQNEKLQTKGVEIGYQDGTISLKAHNLSKSTLCKPTFPT